MVLLLKGKHSCKTSKTTVEKVVKPVWPTNYSKIYFWSNLMIGLKIAFLLGFSSIFVDSLGVLRYLLIAGQWLHGAATEARRAESNRGSVPFATRAVGDIADTIGRRAPAQWAGSNGC
jgi:hypothetical protein